MLGLADDGKVLQRYVPWSTIVMLGAMSILIGVGRAGGMCELLAGFISDYLPRVFVVPLLSLVAGCMSVFSSAISVVLPLMFPMVPHLAELTGLPPTLMFMAIFVSATITGMSPLSTMGGMTLGGCTREEDQSKIFYKVIPHPFIMLSFLIILFLIWSAFV